MASLIDLNLLWEKKLYLFLSSFHNVYLSQTVLEECFSLGRKFLKYLADKKLIV